MKKLFYFVLLLAIYLPSTIVLAQTRTYFKDLSDRSHVPLYDCSIYASSRDRDKCYDLSRGEDVRWENEGYAVDCYDLVRSRRNSCLNLAEDIFHDSGRLQCGHIYRDREALRQCEITKLAYFEGRFQDRGVDRYRPTTVITTTPVTTYSSRTTCDTESYDRAVSIWRDRKEEQRKKGQTRAAVGIAATIGGIILSGSRDNGTRNLGTGLAVGGVLLTSWGLIEIADADITYPHMDPYCKTQWTQETRMVMVERQECVTTRYSENTRFSSRYYYEVRCSNKRYVTFDEFSPWERGRQVTYYRY